jgi:hypothetical protein
MAAVAGGKRKREARGERASEASGHFGRTWKSERGGRLLPYMAFEMETATRPQNQQTG